MSTTRKNETSKTGDVPSLSHTTPAFLRFRRSALIVLLCGFVITAAASLKIRSDIEIISTQDFAARCSSIEDKILDRLDAHARILRSGAAFFNASETVTREEWRIYTKLQKIEQRLPGIQGIGFSLVISRGELDRHIRKIRSEGFPEYRIKPEGDREIYSSIIYLEPFTERNLRAFGYDMLSEPVRRAAMERARDEDIAALSGKVQLVQETDVAMQAGNLMYVPVYRKGMPTGTTEQRRAAIYGWVYSPYRMNDLMHGVLGNPNPKSQKPLHLAVFDGAQPSSRSLLYEDPVPEEHGLRTGKHYTRQIPVDFNGHRWTLLFTQADGELFSQKYVSVWLTMIGGTLITLLLAALVRTLQSTAAVAQRMVDERTGQLAKITRELSIIVENAPCGISKIIDRKQVWVNHQTENLLLYPKEELEFQTTQKLYASDEAYEKLGQEAYPVLSQGGVFETEQELIRKDGTHLLARYIGKAVEPADMSKGTIWLLEDVTERRKAEEEKLALEQQLRQSRHLESLGVLAGGIAHDFNNILAVIICNCSLALQRPKTAVELIPEIEKAANRAAELCRQMLTYAGKAHCSMKMVNIPAILDDMLKMMRATLNQNVVIRPTLADGIPLIKADISQIRQIIMNLIINAAEAIGTAQGEIAVSLTKTEICQDSPEKNHLGNAIPPGGYICLEVTDNGCGMDDETKKRIFEPFYTTKFTGRGLGMPSVLGIITAHKGALQLSSHPGQGSTFKVYLPVKTTNADGEQLQQTTPAPWQGSGSILLVEDEPQLILVAKNLMKALGFTVFEAANGREALELYRKNAEYITMVVTDLGMPVMDGYELIRELKSIDPELPVIVSSGYGDAEVTSRIAEAKVAGFLSKPYSFAQMREVLKSVIDGPLPPA